MVRHNDDLCFRDRQASYLVRADMELFTEAKQFGVRGNIRRCLSNRLSEFVPQQGEIQEIRAKIVGDVKAAIPFE